MIHLTRSSPARRRARLVAALAVGVATGALAPGAPTPLVSADDAPYEHPVPPPKCTAEQAASGDVGDCLLAFYSDPADDGFGVAPVPGEGDGWVWSGYTYAGSPALADFEAENITTNAERIGSIAAGSLSTNALAHQLFEGFLGEIQSRGYDVRHAGGYTFRCTGDWDCTTGGHDDLSLHAWGLAIDMNSDRNPIATYATCDAAVATDFPEWAIRVAERWGLYWGGYGWDRGCNRVGSDNTSVVRDTPHFEFRGTPAQARAIAQFNYGNNPDLRCLDTIGSSGRPALQCNRSGLPGAGWRLPVETGAPEGATAAIVNLTATGATSAGFLTIESCDEPPSGARQTSTLTYAAGESVATLAIAELDDEGRFCVYRSAPVHSVVDVVGYLTDSERAEWLTPAEPTRLLDTRVSTAGPVGAGRERAVPGAAGNLLVNLAAVADGQAGYLQAGACDELGPDAEFSNLNYAGRSDDGPSVRSNLTLVRGADAACVFALAEADVVVDLLGTLATSEPEPDTETDTETDSSDDTSNATGDAEPTGLGWNVSPARRVLDTRQRTGENRPGAPRPGTLIPVDLTDVVADDAAAVAVAITVTETAAPGYVTVGRCDELSQQIDDDGHPATSNLNHLTGQTVTNLAVAALDAGELCAYTEASAHVILDVQAELTPERTIGIEPVIPERLHDSRAPRD